MRRPFSPTRAASWHMDYEPARGVSVYVAKAYQVTVGAGGRLEWVPCRGSLARGSYGGAVAAAHAAGLRFMGDVPHAPASPVTARQAKRLTGIPYGPAAMDLLRELVEDGSE